MINKFFQAALIEGEGFGTAYEYQVKANLLQKYLNETDRVLILGLPEKFGVSANFLILADKMQKPMLVVDDKPELIAEFNKVKQILIDTKLLQHPQLIESKLLPGLAEYVPETNYDLIIIQKLNKGWDEQYLNRLLCKTKNIFIFAPNSNNLSHQKFSKLAGINQTDLKKLSGKILNTELGFIDCPPFPSGIKLQRTPEQIHKQSSSFLNKAFCSIFLGCLNILCRLEKIFPAKIKNNHSHIIYLALKNEKKPGQ